VSVRRPSRKQARRDALFVLYQLEVTNKPTVDLLGEVLQREGYEADRFTADMVAGVLARQADLDEELESHSRNWPLARVAPLERIMLRLALYEIESGVTPPEVAVDEAVRLTRRYSTDEASGLVNGILGSIVRELQATGEEGEDG
jgi:transcription antitermination protein NusB